MTLEQFHNLENYLDAREDLFQANTSAQVAAAMSQRDLWRSILMESIAKENQT